MQVYIYIIYPTLSTLLCTFTFPSRPPQRNPYIFPSLQLNPPPLYLPRAVQPQEYDPLHLRRPSIWTWTNLFQKTHSSYFIFIFIFQSTHCLPQVLHLQVFSQVTVFPQCCAIFLLHPLTCIRTHHERIFPTTTTMPSPLVFCPHITPQNNLSHGDTKGGRKYHPPYTIIF